jgi:hypothetical protein
MKPTKHAKTNFRMIQPFLTATDASPEHSRKFLSGAYMPLCVENLGYTFHGGTVYSIAHYGKQNGDMMRDPDMTISVDHEAWTVDPLTWQNDYMSKYSEVYCTSDGREAYRPKLRADLDRFLWQWLRNILEQKFSPDVYEPDEDDFSDVDPAEIRAKLEEDRKNGSAFVAQVMADVERITAAEAQTDETPALEAPPGDWQQYALFA